MSFEQVPYDQVQNLSLHTGMASNTNSIIHNNQTKPQTDRKQRVRNPMTKRNRRRQSHTQSRMRRRHPTRGKQQTQVPLPLDEEIDNHLTRLREEPREHRRHERRVRRERRHERTDLYLG